jgi:protease II
MINFISAPILMLQFPFDGMSSYQYAKENWKEVIPNRKDVYLAGFTLFKDHMVVSELKEGLMNLRIINQKINQNITCNLMSLPIFLLLG